MSTAESISLCPICGNHVHKASRGFERKFCSRKCSQLSASRAQAERLRVAADEARPMVPCPICGTIFKQKYRRMYCSDKCKEKARRESPQRKAYVAQYRERTIEHDRARAREYMRNRLENDHEFKTRQRSYIARYREENKSSYLATQRKHNAKRRKHNAHVYAWKAYMRKLNQKHNRHVKDFKAFKKTASAGWLARHYKSIGQPWNNPMLSDAIRYRIRYRLDLDFRLGEINRQGWRKETLVERDDGTANFWALLSERKTCPYCGIAITKDNAVADHMDPIKLSGDNGQHNLTICCRDCNRKKSGRHFSDWLAMLPEARRNAARRWYIRKHGKPPEDTRMAFTFAFNT